MQRVARLKDDGRQEEEKEGLRAELLLVVENGHVVDLEEMVDQTNCEAWVCMKIGEGRGREGERV